MALVHGRSGDAQPMRYFDTVTGDLIEVSVSRSYTIVALNGRVYLFDQLTGEGRS